MQSVPTQDQAPVPCQSKEQDVDCLHVEASDRERFVVPTTNLRIAAVLSAALVAYKAVQWLLFFGLGLNWLIVAVLAASLATYWIATLVLKHVFRGGRKGESLKIEGWVFSETMILRKFARFTEAFPVSAIGNVEERSDHVLFTYSSGDVDVVYRSEVDSDTDWAFLLKTLKAKHADYKKAFSTVPSPAVLEVFLKRR